MNNSQKAAGAGLIATTLILANGTLGASVVQLARNYPQTGNSGESSP